jgi:hypothetical protein
LETVIALQPKVKYPTEILTFSMSFADTLQTGETISAVASVASSTAPDGSTLTISSPAVTSGSIFDDDGNEIPAAEAITFVVANGNDENDYRITGTVATSTGNTRVGVGILQVRTGNLV